MKILKKIIKYFTIKKVEKYTLKVVDDLEHYSNDRKLREVAKAYDKQKQIEYESDKRQLLKYLKYKIKFEFLPSAMSSMNVRSASQFIYKTYLKWTEIRNLNEELAGAKCCICHLTNYDRQADEPDKKITCATECHEVWSFSQNADGIFIQKLEKLLSLCFVCHQVFHTNQHKNDLKKMAFLMGEYCKINKVSLAQAEEDYRFFERMRDKNNFNKYLLDMSIINTMNVECRFDDELFNPHTDEFRKFLILEFNKKEED